MGVVIGAPLSELITIEDANIWELLIGAPLSDLITIEAANIWGKLFLSQRFFILDNVRYNTLLIMSNDNYVNNRILLLVTLGIVVKQTLYENILFYH